MLLSLHSMYREANQGVLYNSVSLNRAMNEFLTEEEFERAARSFAETAYAEKLRETGKRIFLDKTPRYYHILDFVEKLFPEAKFIVLSRNPFDIAASICTTFGVGSDELTGKHISPVTFDLDFAIRRLNRLKARNSNAIHIRYEDLVENPDDALKRAQDFLGVETPEVNLDYSQARLYEEARTHAMGDKKIIKYQRPHQDSVSRWKDRLDLETVRALGQVFTTKELCDFGYSDLVSDLRKQGVGFGSEEDVRDRDRGLEAAAKNFFNYPTLLEQQLARCQAELARWRAELAARTYASEQLRRQIDSLHGSICWRMTWPIRWLHKQFNQARKSWRLMLPRVPPKEVKSQFSIPPKNRGNRC
jgi:hypothetical protein